MSKYLWAAWVCAPLCLAGLTQTSAAIGMGDPSAHLREMNALCDRQRRGEAPPQPNFCLPEYPPAAVADGPPQRRRRLE